MDILYKNLLAFDRYDLIMILIGCLLIYLAIHKEMEPSLLLPMGVGMLVIFTVISIIILATKLVNYLFSE